MITKQLPASGKINVNRNLKFTNEERNIILQKHMLSDESINSAQNLLKEQFPDISGFQDTMMGKTQSFDIVKTNENFIHLFHVGSLHWVCVANLSENKSHNGECQLDDSLSNGNVSPDVAKQIAAFSFCDLPEILVEIKGVQQQTNSFDCDLFAIVFATSLAFGEGPANVTYHFMKLRMHLIKCLDEKQMTCFSKSTEKHVSK